MKTITYKFVDGTTSTIEVSITFDLVSLYTWFYKLLVDLSVAWHFIPIWVWIIVAYFVFDYLRKKAGYLILIMHEYANRAFIKLLPIVTLICGVMGKGKTTSLVDMALTVEVIFRQKALEIMLDNDLKFPHFPYINLENEIKAGIEDNSIYNLATTRRYIREMKAAFECNPSRENCWDHDYERYGLEFNDELKLLNLFDMLENYASAYFIYALQTSLLIFKANRTFIA